MPILSTKVMNFCPEKLVECEDLFFAEYSMATGGLLDIAIVLIWLQTFLYCELNLNQGRAFNFTFIAGFYLGLSYLFH